MHKLKLQKIIYFFCIILFSCSTSVVKAKISDSNSKQSNNSENSRNTPMIDNKKKLADIENDELKKLSNKFDKILSENEKQNELINESIEQLNYQVSLFDSLYKKIINNVSSLEDNINDISKSYNEIAQLNSENKIEDIPPISEREFQEKYIESLGAYQNGDLDKSLKGFKYLLTMNSNYELLDNCQYWIGEIYFKMKEYHNSIIELEKVFNYINSNKHDDALYKLSKCYMNLNNEKQANYELKKLVTNYPNSEYVRKAKLILNN